MSTTVINQGDNSMDRSRGDRSMNRSVLGLNKRDRSINNGT